MRCTSNLQTKTGRIHADLTIGADVVGAKALRANEGLALPRRYACRRRLHRHPRRSRKPRQPCDRIRPYRNGKDLTDKPRGVLVIDLFGLSADEVRSRYPATYQWLLERVKPERDQNQRCELPRQLVDIWPNHAANCANGSSACPATSPPSIPPSTASFSFSTPASARQQAYLHRAGRRLLPRRALARKFTSSGRLPPAARWKIGRVYNKSRCFDPFPFPAASPEQQTRIAALAEQLDTHRKRQQAAHPELTLTGMYNVLAKLRSGEAADRQGQDHPRNGPRRRPPPAPRRTRHRRPRRLRLVRPRPRADTRPTLLDRLVALNAERAAEEAAGHIRWLRPEFQNPSARGRPSRRKAGKNGFARKYAVDRDRQAPANPAEKRPWPATLPEQVRAVADQLSPIPLDEPALAARFTGKGPWKKRLPEILAMLAALGRAKRSDGGWVG